MSDTAWRPCIKGECLETKRQRDALLAALRFVSSADEIDRPHAVRKATDLAVQIMLSETEKQASESIRCDEVIIRLEAERDQLRTAVINTSQLVKMHEMTINAGREITRAIEAECNQLRIEIAASGTRDVLRARCAQLRADKAELLAELKRLHAYAMEHCSHTSGLLNASAMIAKHEERK